MTAVKYDATPRWVGSEPCLQCGQPVSMSDEPCEWDSDTGEVLDYGPATGVCWACDLFHAVQLDGMLEAYHLEPTGATPEWAEGRGKEGDDR